ncbi:hypothetical protein [Brevundimonas mediterranea]|uniref:Uncharacterized protein n=1 Tax=Brevundimonas mediterranea TaxID=74329 RepID=A0A7W6A180_9CAUL|nr:hypothetical protein [Brevundimonas mediterranea]MBB3871383.1 hypothetical protein [Brevundimonas mediterranea]
MLQAGLLIISLVALAAPVVWGGRADRWAAVLLLADMMLSPLAQHLMLGDVRWGVALVDLACAIGLIGLALRADRWWLLFAAGLQVAVVLTHFAALGPAFIYNWTAVTVRLATWIALLIVLLAGAYEAHLVRRYRLLPGAPA